MRIRKSTSMHVQTCLECVYVKLTIDQLAATKSFNNKVQWIPKRLQSPNTGNIIMSKYIYIFRHFDHLFLKMEKENNSFTERDIYAWDIYEESNFFAVNFNTNDDRMWNLDHSYVATELKNTQCSLINIHSMLVLTLNSQLHSNHNLFQVYCEERLL